MAQTADRFGRRKRIRRKRMTEEERTQAGRRLERQLQELDARRLDRINGSYSLERTMKYCLVLLVLFFALSAALVYLEK